MHKRLLSLLVCPHSGSRLDYKEKQQELWCSVSRLAYPVEDAVPVLLLERARVLTDKEWEEYYG